MEDPRSCFDVSAWQQGLFQHDSSQIPAGTKLHLSSLHRLGLALGQSRDTK